MTCGISKRKHHIINTHQTGSKKISNYKYRSSFTYMATFIRQCEFHSTIIADLK